MAHPLCSRVGLLPEDMPMLLGADFLLAGKRSAGEEKYGLCEIDVSSVSPFPEAAIEPLTAATSRALAAVSLQHAG